MFVMKKSVCLILAAVLICGLTFTAYAVQMPFQDVKENSWYADAVEYVYSNGLMNGVTQTEFAPGTNMSRAMIVTVLHRSEGSPKPSAKIPFVDVPSSKYYYDSVVWSYENGIVNGVAADKFAPNDNVTREQLVTIFYRYANAQYYDTSAQTDLSGYQDVADVSKFAKAAMSWAVAEGIINGTTADTLSPDGFATRAQFATIMQRFDAWEEEQMNPPTQPTEPEPTETQPTEPEPTEPKPTEPKPTEPEPTETQPTEPKPTEPEPTEPKPTEPKPTEPKPTEPKPTEPKPTEPEPTEPKPTEPKPTEPKPTEPKPTEPQLFIITYVLDGGTNHSKNPVVYTPGDTLTLYDAEKEKFSFEGWYLDSKFETPIFTINAQTQGDLTLYAKWLPVYTITYELNGGRNNSRNPYEYTSETSIALQSPSKSFNTFDGWYLESTYETKITRIDSTLSGDITLYAKFIPNAYTITYELNKGENNPKNPDTYFYGETLVLADPTRENHEFKGWYLESSFKTKVEKIDPTQTGNVKLYAKWNLAQLNVRGESMDNMIWSWWYYPQVVSTEDTVFWGYASNEGYCGVAAYDIATGKTTTTALKKLTTVDDHNGLGLTLLDDGRIMCIYAGGHDSNNEIHVRISQKPYDISNFTTNLVLTSVGKTCYGQIVKSGDRIYVFYRVNSKNWAYRYTQDGVQWSKEVIMVSASDQYYCKVVPTTQEGLLRVCMYSNPTSNDPRIRMGFLDAKTGMLYNSDGKTELGTTKVSNEKFDILIDLPSGKIQRMFDVAVSEPQSPRILYTVFSSAKGSDDSVYYIYDSGKSVKICEGGKPLWDPKYQGGASFAGDDTIVTCRNENGSDIVEVYDYVGGKVLLRETVHTQTVGTNGIRNARPIVDVNGKVFLWHNGYYNPNSYKDFDTDAMMHFIN